jgi:hypothetical protein
MDKGLFALRFSPCVFQTSALYQGPTSQAAEKLIYAEKPGRFVSGHDFSRAANAI